MRKKEGDKTRRQEGKNIKDNNIRREEKRILAYKGCKMQP